ncbi:hypothetical protein CU098_004257 [Rhizopus stolonifer]|uniref:Uncharacterized protein n=1 Tax=Rhizopus stolonifer TaxID=4846 RepID=A0A367IPM8_RHIST|nr:hypothetical protein CU098_004257 [Rhizopus stolonifer]
MDELMSLPSSPHFFLSDDPSSSDQQQQTDQPPEADNDDAMSDNNTEDMEKIQQMLKAYWDYHPSVAQRNIGAREVDDTESTFNVTSFRPGMGVERLRDEEPATFWQ